MRSNQKKLKKKESKNYPNNSKAVIPKHTNNGNLNYYSEEISKEIINKLITLTFIENKRKKIEKQIKTFSINYLITNFNNLIELNSLNHDIDDKFLNDGIKQKHTQKNESKYIKNMKMRKEDFKKYKKLDLSYNDSPRESNTMDKKIKNYQFNVKIRHKNFWGLIEQPKAEFIDRTCNQKNRQNIQVKEEE